jgi:hypothetical protein
MTAVAEAVEEAEEPFLELPEMVEVEVVPLYPSLCGIMVPDLN